MIDKINELLVEAIKNKNTVVANVYRALKTDIINASKSGKEFSEIEIVNKAKKKRLDAAATFQECGRGDMMEAELLEVDIISRLLPKEPTEEEIFTSIWDAVVLYDKNMGMIIKHVKSKYPTVDGKKLSEQVKSYINERS